VYLRLREDILAGTLPPGERLVRRELAKRLDVSPVPVTEALFRLEADGLVESAPMFGARVVPVTAATELDDLVLREALECQAARECAEHATSAALERLAERAVAIDAVMVAGADPRDHAHEAEHGELHAAIAAAAGRGALEKELRRLWFRRQMRRAWENAARVGLPPGWHASLIAAIATRDPQAAETAMRHHVRLHTARHTPQ
jgi:DNA-binding GntR family transcriptional regulator